MGLFMIIQSYNLLTSVIIFIQTKTASLKLEDKNKMTIRLEARVRSTSAVLNLIDTIVTNEVIGALKTYARLGENYKTMNTVDDIAAISKKVFDAIKKEIFSDNDTILTDEYLMTYINERTTLAFLIETQNLNNTMK